MTKKEKIRLATKIADAEIVILTSKSKDEINEAKNNVLNLTNKIESFSDLDDIHELTMIILADKKKKFGL